MAVDLMSVISLASPRRRHHTTTGVVSHGLNSRRHRAKSRLLMVAAVMAVALLLLVGSLVRDGAVSPSKHPGRALKQQRQPLKQPLLHQHQRVLQTGGDAGKRHVKLEQSQAENEGQAALRLSTQAENKVQAALRMSTQTEQVGEQELEAGEEEEEAVQQAEEEAGQGSTEGQEQQAEGEGELQPQVDGEAEFQQQGEAERGSTDGEDELENEEQEEEEEEAADAVAGVAATTSSSGGEEGREAQEQERSPYYRAVSFCQDLACLKAASQQERAPGQFLFPHFLILGWQKCATTSLFRHLATHPQALASTQKEPEFFSWDCKFDPEGCPKKKEKEYIDNILQLQPALDSNLERATYEGSTHYGREGQVLAAGLYEVFPWVKLIVSMREPISRAISMLAHNMDKSSRGCLMRRDVFVCLEQQMPELSYHQPFSAWLDTYPREQIMLLQYENLTSADNEAQNLRAVKSFLGLNPELPKNELEQHNSRAQRLGEEPEGWPMKKWQYEKLISLVRPDAEKMAKVVTQHRFGDGGQWLRTWEAAWQANLDKCDAKGNCDIQLT